MGGPKSVDSCFGGCGSLRRTQFRSGRGSWDGGGTPDESPPTRERV